MTRSPQGVSPASPAGRAHLRHTVGWDRLPALAMQVGSADTNSVALSLCVDRATGEKEMQVETDVPSSAAPECSLTILEFCTVENFSPATYVKLRRLGYGPEELRIPGTDVIRITPQARRDWHVRMGCLRKEQAAQLERERARRSEQASAAGKLGAQSPHHPCRRRAAKRRSA